MKELIARLKELLEYEPQTGKVFTKKKRLVTPDHSGFVIIFDKDAASKSKKFKLDKLAYALAFGVFPEDYQMVLHKNMDELDNRMNNLTLVSREVYKQVKEAHRNLTGGIHIVPHATDQFAYILKWYEQGQEKHKIIQDIVVARRSQLRLQLKYSKILTKYCIFDN